MDKSVDKLGDKGGKVGVREIKGNLSGDKGKVRKYGENIHNIPQFIHRLFHKDLVVMQTRKDRK